MTDKAEDIGAFFTEYATAFSACDSKRMARLFLLPALMADNQASVALFSQARARETLEGILDLYRRYNLAEAEPLEIVWDERSESFIDAKVKWRLTAADHSLICSFESSYVLRHDGGRLRIVCLISHNETDTWTAPRRGKRRLRHLQ